MKRVYNLFFVLNIAIVSVIQVSQVLAMPLNPMQAYALHKAYETYGDSSNFIDHLPASVEQCRQELIAEQQSVQARLDAFSYKNVFFSRQGLLKTGMLTASLVGMWVVGNKVNMDEVAYQVANDFANRLFNDAAGWGGAFLINGKPRIRPYLERQAADIAFEKGYEVSSGDINRQWPDEIWREIIPNLPEGERNSQVIENSPVKRILELKKYQLVSQALTVGATVSGFGLYKDIQAMRAAKAELTAMLNKINAMLAVLEKVQ